MFNFNLTYISIQIPILVFDQCLFFVYILLAFTLSLLCWSNPYLFGPLVDWGTMNASSYTFLFKSSGYLAYITHVQVSPQAPQCDFLWSLSKAFNIIFTKIRTLIILISLVYNKIKLLNHKKRYTWHSEAWRYNWRAVSKQLTGGSRSSWELVMAPSGVLGMPWLSVTVFTAETKCSSLVKKLVSRTSICLSINEGWLLFKGFF